MDNKKDLLFSVTKKDLRIDTFRCGGKGGQNVNKRDTGVRIVHIESGAIGESREQRTQEQNKKVAFRRMAESKEFKSWVKLKAAAIAEGHRTIEAKIDKMMAPENLKIEYIGD